jgi:C4-dicarboxylate-specific signal transduction histidine kinase
LERIATKSAGLPWGYPLKTEIMTEAESREAHNGTGIPKQYRDKVFEQFFTTKDVGSGSGQGLAYCYDIVVNRSNGRLYFDSKLGRGTTFHIELPKQSN